MTKKHQEELVMQVTGLAIFFIVSIFAVDIELLVSAVRHLI